MNNFALNLKHHECERRCVCAYVVQVNDDRKFRSFLLVVLSVAFSLAANAATVIHSMHAYSTTTFKLSKR